MRIAPDAIAMWWSSAELELRRGDITLNPAKRKEQCRMATVLKTPSVEYPPDPWPPTDPERLRALAAELETFDFPRGFRTVAQRGACLGMPPERFFLSKGGRDSAAGSAMAKRICAGCPVRRTCLLVAMWTSDVHGFWGGTNQKQRVRLRGTLRRITKDAAAR